VTQILYIGGPLHGHKEFKDISELFRNSTIHVPRVSSPWQSWQLANNEFIEKNIISYRLERVAVSEIESDHLQFANKKTNLYIVPAYVCEDISYEQALSMFKDLVLLEYARKHDTEKGN
jgi:hypothetical protein